MSIRLRLALWYSAVLAVTLVVFSLLLYVLMERHLIDEADSGIASRAQHIASTIRVENTPEATKRVELPPIDAFEAPGVYVQVVDKNGVLVGHSDNLGGQALPTDDQAFATAQNGRSVFYTSAIQADRVRVYLRPLLVGGELVGFVQVGRSQSEAFGVLDRLRLGLLGVGLVSLLLAGGIAWAVAGTAMAPIASITRTARAIALSRGFSRRLENTASSSDELGELSRTFNEMLVSLNEAYAAQQRFVADASHELRAPLTAIRANLELLRRQGESLPKEERQALRAAASEEADRMGRLVADLLSLARADAGQKIQLRQTELDRLLLDAYAEARLLAHGIKLTIDDIDEVTLPADADRLKQLILILVDNALRYTLKGEVRLALRKANGMAVIEVSDSGIGIGEDDLPHIFERFYRADKARARDTAGTGLGLAIAKWIVEQHGGDIAVQSVLGTGSTFTVRLPLQPD